MGPQERYQASASMVDATEDNRHAGKQAGAVGDQELEGLIVGTDHEVEV
jgi:hypothetical protein